MTRTKAESPQPQLMTVGRFSYTTKNHYQFTEGLDALMKPWTGSACSPHDVGSPGQPGVFHQEG